MSEHFSSNTIMIFTGVYHSVLLITSPTPTPSYVKPASRNSTCELHIDPIVNDVPLFIILMNDSSVRMLIKVHSGNMFTSLLCHLNSLNFSAVILVPAHKFHAQRCVKRAGTSFSHPHSCGKMSGESSTLQTLISNQ